MMFSKANNIEGLWDFEYMLKLANSGIFFFTTKSPKMQKLVADELKIYDIAVFDYSKYREDYSYYKLERFADQNPDKKILVVLNLQNAMIGKYSIVNLNLSRDMLYRRKQVWIFGMTEFLKDVILINAIDFYSWVNLKVSFEDENVERDSHYEFIASEEGFLKLSFIDDLLETYENPLKDGDDKDLIGDDNKTKSSFYSDIYEKIASLNNKKFEYDEALSWYFKSLNIREKIFDSEDPSIADLYNDIGVVYRNKGDYDKALEFYFKALDIREKVLWEGHTDIAFTCNNIGVAYSDTGEYDKALGYYFRALEIFQKVLRKENPSNAILYNNIGGTYGYKEDFDKALEYFFKSLETFEESLGSESPGVATSYDNIGSVYRDRGEFTKALEFYNKAMKIRQKRFGEEHPSTKQSYKNIAKID
ncbi:MAG: tetratricopeptide repeat protein [Oscillospiraceae bacterium]|nr:tetratricopeptide repeat protein [Oscillospiraceae bacterium]